MFVRIIVLVFLVEVQGHYAAANFKTKTEHSRANLIDKLTERLADQVLKSPNLRELDNTVLGKPARQESIHNTETVSPLLPFTTLPTKETFTKAAQNAFIGGAAVAAGTAGIAETAATFGVAAHVARNLFANRNEPVVGNPS